MGRHLNLMHESAVCEAINQSILCNKE